MTTAAYSGSVRYSTIGSSTLFTDEPTTNISGTDKYQVTDSTIRIWDRDGTIVVKDDGVDITSSDVEEINYLFGYVRLTSGYTPTGAITVSGKYLVDVSEVEGAHEFTLSLNNENLDETTFKSATDNSGGKSMTYGLKDASLTSTLYFSDSDLNFLTDFIDSEPLLVEWESGHPTETHTWRAFVIVESNETSGSVDGLEDESVTLSLVEKDIPSGAIEGINYVNIISLMYE